jgi:hypothetical protein
MPEPHDDANGNGLRSRRAPHGTRRWALGGLLAAVAAGTARAGEAAHKPSHANPTKDLPETFPENPSIGDMFDNQLMQNLLIQLSERRTTDHP